MSFSYPLTFLDRSRELHITVCSNSTLRTKLEDGLENFTYTVQERTVFLRPKGTGCSVYICRECGRAYFAKHYNAVKHLHCRAKKIIAPDTFEDSLAKIGGTKLYRTLSIPVKAPPEDLLFLHRLMVKKKILRVAEGVYAVPEDFRFLIRLWPGDKLSMQEVIKFFERYFVPIEDILPKPLSLEDVLEDLVGQ